MITKERRAQCLPALLGTDADEWLSNQQVVVDCWISSHPPASSGEWRVLPFRPSGRAVLDIQRLARQLSAWTGWSSRALADVLDTTHTTVQALQRGRPLQGSRSGMLGDRLGETHQVVERLDRLTHGDARATARALTRPDADGMSAVDHLRARRPSAAYLAAIDALRPRVPGMLTGTRPARGDATAPLTE